MSDYPMYPDSPEESSENSAENTENRENTEQRNAEPRGNDPRDQRSYYEEPSYRENRGNYPPPSGGSYRGTYGNNYGDPYGNSYNRTYADDYRGYSDDYAPRGSSKPPKKSGSSGKHTGWIIALVAVCCVLVGGTVGGLVTGLVMNHRQQEAEVTETVQQPVPVTEGATEPEYVERPTEPRGDAIPLEQLYEQSVPCIVGITNQSSGTDIFGRPVTSTGTGTGFIISPDGEILTNYHVAEGAEVLTVTMSDGTTYDAKLVGYEAESDVALLKIDGENLPTVTLGNSDQLRVGDQIAAIGNPLGELTYTMTVGYVSAMGRTVRSVGTPINMMQIDAAINPGNSGGPLFNAQGQVVGITSAKYSGMVNGGATIEGIGFAIPINDVLSILDEIREFGTVQDRAYLGVHIQDSQDKDVPGAQIASVDDGSCAANAGLKAGDIIIGVDGKKVTGSDSLYQVLRGYRAGDQAKITFSRKGQSYETDATFDTRPEPEPQPEQEQPEAGDWEDVFGGIPWIPFLP